MIAFADYPFYQKSLNKVLSFVVMGASKYFLCYLSHYYVMYKMSVCMYVKQQTDDVYA